MPCEGPMPAHNLAEAGNMSPDLYQAMSVAFGQYSEIVELSAHDSENARTRLQLLEQECHSRGLCGHNFLHLMKVFHSQIGWERMVPDEFTRFYRFVFHLCKQPNRRHIQVEVALEAWRLLLNLRFRLLDKWCDYIALHKTTLKVINEDQWRQVLEFSRAVHEDLSNYDPNGAWACFLDDFVEHMRCQRQPSRSYSNMDDDLRIGGFLDRQDMTVHVGVPVSPRPGSKRRSPDVDVVAERLSAFPLPSSTASEDIDRCHMALGSHPLHLLHPQHHQLLLQPQPQPGSATKRHCTEVPGLLRQAGAPVPAGGLQQGMGLALGSGGAANGFGMPCLGLAPPGLGLLQDQPQAFTFELPMLAVAARRHIKPRRSNVSELVHHTVSGALFLNNE